MQLLAHTTLSDDPQLGVNDEVEYALVALKTKEDLAFGEDLLIVTELQAEPITSAELAPKVAALAEFGAEHEVTVKRPTPVKEPTPVEMVVARIASVVKEEDLAAACTVALQEEASEWMVTIHSDKTDVAKPEEALVVKKEGAAVVSETPFEFTTPVKAPTDNAAPVVASSAPHKSPHTSEAATLSPGEVPATLTCYCLFSYLFC